MAPCCCLSLSDKPPKLRDGKATHDQAVIARRYIMNVLLPSWNEAMETSSPNGIPPTGRTFDDIARAVLRKLYIESVKAKPSKHSRTSSSSADAGDDLDDDGVDVSDIPVNFDDIETAPAKFAPPHWFAFLLMGPYAVAKYNTLLPIVFCKTAAELEAASEGKSRIAARQAMVESPSPKNMTPRCL